MVIEYDGTPTTGHLISERDDAGVTWQRALAELIDNSLDAGASQVVISLLQTKGRRTVIVEDDGNGCEDLQRMIVLGDSYQKSTTKLGRFGVGFKKAVLWLWGKTKISTVSDGVLREITMDWQEVVRKQSWKWVGQDPVPAPRKNGTVIECSNVIRGFKSHEELADDLGFIFGPALRDGKQIKIQTNKKNIECRAYQSPPCDPIREDEFSVNGKSVRMRVGVVLEGHANRRAGFIIYHEHRMIDHNPNFGANGYSLGNIAGELWLDKKWRLDRTKGGVVDPDIHLLDEEVFKRCKDIYEVARQKTKNLELENLSKAIGTALRCLQQNKRKAKRHATHEKQGTVLPTGLGGEHQRAKNTQRGNRKLRSGTGLVKIDFAHMGEDMPMRKVSLIPAACVMFNLDHPWVKIIEANPVALIGHVVEGLMMHEQEQNLPGHRDYTSASQAASEQLRKIDQAAIESISGKK